MVTGSLKQLTRFTYYKIVTTKHELFIPVTTACEVCAFKV